MRFQEKAGKASLGGLLCVLASLVVLAPAAPAAVLASYPFTNNSLASTDTNGRSTASAITIGGGLTDATRFTNNGNPDQALVVNTDETGGTSFPTAATAGDYFSLTLTADNGLRFNFTNFTVDLATNATTFSSSIRLQASTDNGATFTNVDTVNGFTSATAGAYTTETFSLTAANANPAIAAGGPVLLRVLVFDTDNTTGNYTAFDNITLNGTLTAAVPEPGTVALLTCGAAAAGGLILRRRKR